MMNRFQPVSGTPAAYMSRASGDPNTRNFVPKKTSLKIILKLKKYEQKRIDEYINFRCDKYKQ